MGRDAIAKLGPKPEHSPTHSSKGLFYVFSILSCCKNRIRVWPDMFFLPKTSRVCCSRAGIIPSVGQRGRRGLRGPSTCINMYHVSLVPGRRRQSWSYTFVMRVSYLFIYFLFFDIVAHAMPTKQSCSRFCGFQTASMPHHKICMFTTYLFIVCFDGSVCSPCAHREETHYEAKLHWVEFGIMNHVACFCYIAFTRCYDNVIYTTMCMKG